jgi:molecular chaperone GrpE
MVKINNDKKNLDDVEITTEDRHDEDELLDIEEQEANKLQSLRKKLKTSEDEKKALQDELQRSKADFLNARKRLEEERVREYSRSVIKFVEQLLPLCDSFHMAISDKKTWEKADENWRKGVEGIYAQLQSLLASYQVRSVSPLGEQFDPHRHDALTTIPVTNLDEHNQIKAVVQLGYELQRGDGQTELIRPARVAIGHFEQN